MNYVLYDYDFYIRFYKIIFVLTGVLLKFIRATREINWDLQLATFRSMLPWFFICDRTNYARYRTAYWLEMIALDRTHPS